MMPRNPTIGFVSLGCPKATVDSERILTQLKVEGYDFSSSYAEADLVIVNTCGFIEAAEEESLDAIGEALHVNGKVIVTGCLGAKESLIRARHPGVLAITGAHEYEAVMREVHAHLPIPSRHPHRDLLPASGIKLTPRHYAYLKISEGCNHHCSFCIIPSMRGTLVSRPIGEVMREAERLVADGVKELLVIAQDTSAYGVDLRYRTDFVQGRPVRTRFYELCQELGKLDAWTRLHYVYPYPHVDDVIPLMRDGVILPYLDVPMQHASASVIRAMQRPAAGEKMLERIAAWREICPELVIRSTFIVGFPGETEADFLELLDFIDKAQLDRVGCFAYSAVDGAGANTLPGQVPEAEKQRRLEAFMTRQAGISAAKLRNLVGYEMAVLVDEVRDDATIARSFADAPEVDGVVIMPGQHGLTPGQFVDVEIVDSTEFDLIAIPASGDHA